MLMLVYEIQYFSVLVVASQYKRATFCGFSLASALYREIDLKGGEKECVREREKRDRERYRQRERDRERERAQS